MAQQLAFLIAYTCRTPSHLAAPSRLGAGGLFLYRNAWAYCDGAVDDDEHRWVATGDVPIASLIRWPHRFCAETPDQERRLSHIGASSR